MSEQQTCPSCAQPASGRFCANCGANLEQPAGCPGCGHRDLPAGARFCNQCGTTLRPVTPSSSEPAPARGSPLPWAVAGVAVAALAGALLWPRLGGGDEEPAGPAAPAEAPFAGGAGAPAGDARSVDISSMTPREAADRLFNRVMQSVSSGDTAQAKQFLPMALMAYERVPDLDRDGRYHVAVLQLVNDDAQAARAQAQSILAEEPNHLFGLFTAAQAEAEAGNAAAARQLYQRFLDSYDEEVARQLPEYGEHSAALGPMKEEAQRAVGG